MQITVAPNGDVLPCPVAGQIAGLPIENVRQRSVAWIWDDSPAFNRFRGVDWMLQPCRSCPRQSVDFGGCRCQAFLLTGDAAATDPVCYLSPHHALIEDAVRAVNRDCAVQPALVYRGFNTLAAAPGATRAASSRPEGLSPGVCQRRGIETGSGSFSYLVLYYLTT